MMKLPYLMLVITTISFQLFFSDTRADENSYIEANKKKAAASTNDAMFTVHRITCLKASGNAALAACNKALAIKPNDVVINNRKATLLKALRPPPTPKVKVKQPKPPVARVAPPVVKKKQPVLPVPVSTLPKQDKAKNVEKKNRPIEKEKAKKEAVEKRDSRESRNAQSKKKMTKRVQTILNQLGFDIGVADGVAGKKTYKAIKKFQKLSKRSLNRKIDAALLSTLKKAQSKHKKANTLHTSATKQQDSGKLDKALTTIEKGLASAPWHKALKILKTKIEQQIASEKSNEAEKVKLAKATLENEREEAAKKVETQKAKKIQNDKKVAKQEKLLSSIQKRQQSLAMIDGALAKEQQELLSDAQKTIDKHRLD